MFLFFIPDCTNFTLCHLFLFTIHFLLLVLLLTLLLNNKLEDNMLLLCDLSTIIIPVLVIVLDSSLVFSYYLVSRIFTLSGRRNEGTLLIFLCRIGIRYVSSQRTEGYRYVFHPTCFLPTRINWYNRITNVRNSDNHDIVTRIHHFFSFIVPLQAQIQVQI